MSRHLKVDLDGNGLINFAEFVTMMRKCKVDTDFDRQIREAFKVRHTNKPIESTAAAVAPRRRVSFMNEGTKTKKTSFNTAIEYMDWIIFLCFVF